VDVVEDVLPLYNIRIGVRMDRPATHVFLAPQGQTLPHETADDVTWTTVPEIRGHQVVVFA
jgi:hypothetical protein